MARRYAGNTRVTVDRSRAEIESTLQKHGATSTAVFTSPERAAVCFEMRGRRVLFKLALPTKIEAKRRPKNPASAIAQLHKQRWRSLLLSIKAKLVSVAEGIETFEDSFLAHIVMPDGQSVADHVRPSIASAYQHGRMVPLLPAPGAA